MFIIAINVTLIEVVVLNAGTIILGVTIYFFLQSRKSLLRTMDFQSPNNLATKYKPVEEIHLPKNGSLNSNKKASKSIDISELKEHLTQVREQRAYANQEEPLHKKGRHAKEDLTVSLKETIARQQKILDGFLQQVEELEDGGKEELFQKNDELLSDV